MRKTLTALCVVLVMSGCSLIPEYKQPQVAFPVTWKDGSIVAGSETINADWWKSFQSGELNGIMSDALSHNLDLQASLARVNQSRASAKIAGAALLPTVDASLSSGANQNNNINGNSGGNHFASNSNLGLTVGYELDLFGANRAGVAAAQANLRGSMYSYDALGLVVMGDVADGYFTLLSLRERVALAQKNIGILKEVLKIAQARYDAGSVSLLDVSQQKSALATSQASLALLQRQQDAAENALAILLGKAPQDLGLTGTGLHTITVPKVPVSQPSTVLAQRPDIKSAEENLVSANADIGVARAAFFPTLNLSAGAGLGFIPVADPATTTLSVAASLLAPIFRGGALQGGVELATARQVEIAQEYRLTVLTALQEVNDSLMAVKTARLREDALYEAMQQARKSYELSRGLYEAGSADYQTMLDSQRTLISAEDAYASVRLETLEAAINLYKALGGGWVDTVKPAAKTAVAAATSAATMTPAVGASQPIVEEPSTKGKKKN
ncbi:MAG: efflux transporter outer membrane subunit [Micavibrio sp.]|nr:efflux transporter outer membrane subunit [Micavibrio sp.]